MNFKQNNVSAKEITDKYELEFLNDMRLLGVKPPSILTKVTDYMPQIILFIDKLLKQGLAYIVSDGSVYFDLNAYSKDHAYGKLNSVPAQEMEPDVSNVKRSTGDFALWKGKKFEGEPSWATPWSAIQGRPGWHIECSAMARLREQFKSTLIISKIKKNSNILLCLVTCSGHGWMFTRVALTLLFLITKMKKHNVAAITGSNSGSAIGFTQVNTLIKNQMFNFIDTNHQLFTLEHLHLSGSVKMSKSLKNTVSIEDFLQCHSADQFRMMCLMSHYRNEMEYSEESLNLAKDQLKSVQHFISDCDVFVRNPSSTGLVDTTKLLRRLKETKDQVRQHFADDFNTAQATQSVRQLMSETLGAIKSVSQSSSNSTRSGIEAVAAIANFVTNYFDSLGFDLKMRNNSSSSSGHSDFLFNAFIDDTVQFRHQIRQFALAADNHQLTKVAHNTT